MGMRLEGMEKRGGRGKAEARIRGAYRVCPQCTANATRNGAHALNEHPVFTFTALTLHKPCKFCHPSAKRCRSTVAPPRRSWQDVPTRRGAIPEDEVINQ